MPKTSALPPGTTPTGPELIAVVQGGVNVRLTAAQIAALGGGGGGGGSGTLNPFGSITPGHFAIWNDATHLQDAGSSNVAGGPVVLDGSTRLPAVDGSLLTNLNASSIASGTVPASRLPPPSSTTLGGIKANAGLASRWVATINTDGSVNLTQPAFTDLTGNIATTQMNAGTSASSSTFWRGDGVWATPSGGGNVSNVGSPASGQLALWTGLTTIQGVTLLPAANSPAYTGDVSSSAGSLTTTLVNIPTAVTVAGFMNHTTIAAPATPAAGHVNVWADLTNNILSSKNSAGVVSNTVVPSSAPANQFGTGLSAAGVMTYGQPAFTNLTGNIAVSQMNSGTGATTSTFWRGDGTWATPAGGGNVSNVGTPSAGQLALWTSATQVQGLTALPAANFPALTGDVTTSAGSLTTAVANIPTGVAVAGFMNHTVIAAPATPAVSHVNVWADSTNLVLSSKNSAGTVSNTVVPSSASANQFATGVGAAGVVTYAQPAFTNLSGNIATSQMNNGTGASVSTFWRGDGTWQTIAGGGNVSNSGAPSAGQLATWTNATTIQGVTALPGANFPALTGDVTTVAGSLVTTLANIPNGTPAAGYLLATAIVAPSTPAAGKGLIYIDSTTKVLSNKNDAGTVSNTVVSSSAPANQFANGVSAAGVVAYAQPAFSNLSGNIAVSQMASGAGASSSTFWRGDNTWATPAGGGNVSNSGSPTAGQLATWTSATVIQGVTALPATNFPALTGDVTTSAGSLATTLANIPSGTPAAGSIIYTAIAAPATPAAGKGSVYVDSTNKVLAHKNDAGTVSSTVVPSTAAANQFANGVSAAGVLAYAQPAFSNLSGNIATSQMNNGTGASSTTFWRGDGTWATPAGGGGSPGGSTTQIQVNTSGAFAGVSNLTSDGTNITGARIKSTASLDWDSGASAVDLSLFRDGANILAQRNGTSAQSFRAYNTFTNSSNYERGVFDWSTTSNSLTIGTQSAGTGSVRDVVFTVPGSNTNWTFYKPIFTGGPSAVTALIGRDQGTGLNGIWLAGGHFIGWASSGLPEPGNALVFGIETCIGRQAPGVIGLSVQVSNVGAYLNWSGQGRVASDFSVTSNAALANITGLSVQVSAGRTYAFTVYLSCTCAAAGGVKAAIGGTATATAIIYDGYALDANTQKGQANSTALGGAVASTTTTSTSGVVIEIQGCITVNAAGTLTVQFAQNTSNATASVVKRGSWMNVDDIA